MWNETEPVLGQNRKRVFSYSSMQLHLIKLYGAASSATRLANALFTHFLALVFGNFLFILFCF